MTTTHADIVLDAAVRKVKARLAADRGYDAHHPANVADLTAACQVADMLTDLPQAPKPAKKRARKVAAS